MINVVSGLEYEFQRLFISVEALFNHHYRYANLLVLPYLISGYKRAVFLPANLDKQFVLEIRRILGKEQAFNSINDIFSDSNKRALDELYKQFSLFSVNKVSENHIRSLKEKIDYIYPILSHYLVDTFPVLNVERINIDIVIVKYGSLVSFNNVISNKEDGYVRLFVREDMGLTEVIEGIVSAFLSDYFKQQNYSWIQREKVIDFLLTQTKLSKLVKGYSPTISNLDPKHDKSLAKMYADSVRFLEKIGYSFDEDLNIVEGHVFVNGKKSEIKFTKSEKKILELLLRNREKVVSYFMIGDILWDDPDKFSLWAISRLVYKIKYKLKKAGFPVVKLQNVRGEGYQLDK